MAVTTHDKLTTSIMPKQQPVADVYAPANRNRRRGLLSSMTTALAHPAVFFSETPRGSQTVLVALIILVLTGFAAVRLAPSADAAPEMPIIDPAVSGPVDGPSPMEGGPASVEVFSSDPGVMPPPDFSGMPPEMGGPPVDGGSGGESADVNKTTMTALTAAGGVVLGWFTLAGILVIVPMLRGRSPHLSSNLQVAIWSSVPLALMLVAQLVFNAVGGTLGSSMGLSLLLQSVEGFEALPAASQSLLTSLTSQITLFGLWSLVLIYAGARYALRGSRLASTFAVTLWIALVVVAPVAVQALRGA